MECPHCHHKHGSEWVGDQLKNIDGKKGEFFRLPIKMERSGYCDSEQETVWACPKCGILFIIRSNS